MAKVYCFRTSEEVSTLLNIEQEASKQLSRAATETLGIIAYHQPITRSQIEEIRGVSLSKGTLDILLELEWIKPIDQFPNTNHLEIVSKFNMVKSEKI